MAWGSKEHFGSLPSVNLLLYKHYIVALHYQKVHNALLRNQNAFCLENILEKRWKISILKFAMKKLCDADHWMVKTK